jgi:hypothetical protein
MHYNTGYQQEALTLVRHFVEVFGASDVEAIVAASASCAGMVRDLYPKAAAQSGDARLVAQVDALVPRVYELGEFLVKRLGVVDVGAYFPHRVTLAWRRELMSACAGQTPSPCALDKSLAQWSCFIYMAADGSFRHTRPTAKAYTPCRRIGWASATLR